MLFDERLSVKGFSIPGNDADHNSDLRLTKRKIQYRHVTTTITFN